MWTPYLCSFQCAPALLALTRINSESREPSNRERLNIVLFSPAVNFAIPARAKSAACSKASSRLWYAVRKRRPVFLWLDRLTTARDNASGSNKTSANYALDRNLDYL
jgi:hypothetical protein